MKKIYRVGTKQDFTYKPSKKFNAFIIGDFKAGEYWIVRNVKYIYANDREEAKEKYKKWFFKEQQITYGWGNWYIISDGVNSMMDERNIDITSTEIVSIREDDGINENIETLKEHMQAENFKEWWFDDCNAKELI